MAVSFRDVVTNDAHGYCDNFIKPDKWVTKLNTIVGKLFEHLIATIAEVNKGNGNKEVVSFKIGSTGWDTDHGPTTGPGTRWGSTYRPHYDALISIALFDNEELVHQAACDNVMPAEFAGIVENDGV